MAGIVVVSYNSADVIEECLRACLQLSGWNLLVVDNASTDDTVQRARALGANVLANATNLGFAAAANQGILALEDACVLILNPDTVLLSGLQALEAAASSPNVGAAGGKLLGPDGLCQDGFNVRAFPTPATLVFEILGVNRIWKSNPVNRRYRLRMQSSKTVPVEQPAGAFLMVNRISWDAVGGFDERFYPIWFEDVDFCKRLQERGYSCLYVPAAVARHEGGHSAKRLGWSSRQIIWYGSLLRYTSKHYSIAARTVIGFTLLVACLPRLLVGVVVTKSLKPFGVYSKVIRLAYGHVRSGDRTLQAIAETTAMKKHRSVRQYGATKSRDQ